MACVSSSSATKSVRGDSTGAMLELEAFKDENFSSLMAFWRVLTVLLSGISIVKM
jgi:hypothetical protein